MRQWVIDNPEFAAQYTRSRDLGLDTVAEEVVEIADEAEDAAKGRLRFDARRWYLSKLAPKKYGDRLNVEHDVSQRLYDWLTDQP